MRLSLACLALLAVACRLDTDLPQTPQYGAVVGRLDTQGRLPLEGQGIVLSSGSERRVQPTDGEGAFSFTGLPPGLYLVSVTLPGFARFSSELLQVRPGLTTDAGVLLPDWLQASPQQATLRGRVAAMTGGDVVGAQVEFLLKGGPSPVAIAQVPVTPDGRFAQQLPPGRFTLRASHPLYQSATRDVELAAAEDKDLTAAPLVLDINPATLEGQVFMERDGLPSVPAAGADVTLVETGQTTKVDPAGNYRLAGLSAGTWQVRFSGPGLHDSVPSRPVRLQPAMTTTMEPVQLLLDRGTIVGTVKLADNGPVSGTRVELTGTIGYAALVAPDAADPSRGHYTLANVPAGITWSLTARREQYAAASTAVLVVKGAPVVASLLTLGRLFGDFRIEDADPDNTAGYTRTRQVMLNLDKFPATGVMDFRASEDDTFDGGVFLPYTGPMQPFVLQPGEGTHTVYAQYRDLSGQVSQAFSSTIVLDTVRPSTPQVTLEASGTDGTSRYINRAQDLRLRVLADDGTGSGLARMRLAEATDGQGNVTGTAVAFSVDATLRRASTADGPQAAFVQVLDHAGNASPAGTDRVIVDTVAPTGSIALLRGPRATEDGYTNSPLVTVTQAYADGDGGLVLVKLSNTLAGLGAATYQPASPQVGWFLDPNGEGQKRVFANFRDAAGNERALGGSAADEQSITYDITAPTPAAASLVGPTTTNQPLLTLALTTNTADLASTEALTLSDEATFTSAATVGPVAFPATSQAAFTLAPGDGVRQVYVRFRDRAGNDAIAAVALTLDTQPPEGGLTLAGQLADGTPSSSVTTSPVVTVHLRATGATEYRLGDASMTACPSAGYSPLVSTTLVGHPRPADGAVTLCLRDAAGNRAGPYRADIALDGAGPANCALSLAGRRVDGSPAPAGLTAQATVTATIGGCQEAPHELVLSQVPVTCSATAALAWQPFAATQQVALAAGDGARTVYGCVRDAARNVTALGSASLTVDTTPPSPATATLLSANPTNSLTATLALSATDLNGLGATDAVTASEDVFFLSRNAGPMALPATGQLPYALSSGDGPKTVYVRFRDAVGNEAFATVLTTYDGTPPTGSLVIQGALADGTPSTDVTTLNSVLLSVTHTGATGYALGNEALTACPTGAASYSALTGTSIASTLSSTLTPREVRLCLRDAAGNVGGPFSDTIAFDATAPSGCTLSLSGSSFNGVTPPAGKTATVTVTASTACAGEAPRDIVLSTSPITCSATASYPWQSFASSLTAVLAGPDGTNTVSGCVRDAARNVSALVAGTITLDRVGPLSPSVLIDNGNAFINLDQTTARGGNVGVVTGNAVGAAQWTLSESSSSFPAWTTASGSASFTFGGTGARTVYAKFRDDVGNESAVASDSIELDVQAPTVTTSSWTFLPPPGALAGFTNDTNALFSLANLPTDAAGVQVAQAASCTAASFTGAAVLPRATPLAFTLTGTDGTKTLCARVLDPAGNASAPLASLAVVLDRVSPTAPVITTAALLLGKSASSSFTVTTVGPVVEANFDRYEKSGGTATTWGSNGGTDTVIGTTAFAYTLQPDRGNTLRLRAVDKAGNRSPEDSVVITWDRTAPGAVTLRDVWVDNGSGRSSLVWRTNPADTDVVAYKVYYGPLAGSVDVVSGIPTGLTGSNAIEGASPVVVPASRGATDQSLALTGLTNGSVVYASVTAVDAAGNEGPAPQPNAQLSRFSVALEPNDVSMNRIATLTLPGAGVIEAISIQGDVAYVAGRTNTSCTPAGASTLTVVSLSTLSSALAGGRPDLTAPQPTITSGPTTFADNVGCTGSSPQRTLLVDVLADGPYLFFASGSTVRIFSLDKVGAPTLLSTVALPGGLVAQSLQLVGDRLLVTGDPHVIPIDLKDLYDADATTTVTASDIIGTAAPINQYGTITWASSATVTRNRLVQYTSNGGSTYGYLLDNALTTSPTFSSATASIQRDFSSPSNYLDGLVTGRPGVANGNYLYFAGTSRFNVFKLQNLWSSTNALSAPGLNPNGTDLIESIQSAAGEGLAFDGNQGFYLSSSTLRSVDLTAVPGMRETSLTVFDPLRPMRSVALYGHYLLAATGVSGNATLHFFELATPRSLRQVGTGAGGGPVAVVGPGFLYSGNARVFDLHEGTNLAPTAPVIQWGSLTDTFLYDLVRLGDTLVTAQGPGFTVFDVRDATDRDPATSWTAADATVVAHPIAGARVTGLADYGNFLLAATVRSDGVWLEVYDARPLRNPGLGVTFNASTHLRGAFLAVPLASPSATLWAGCSVRAGRAFISLDDQATASLPTRGVVIVDFRPLVDDVAGGSASLLGSLSLTGIRDTVSTGDVLYAAGASEVVAVDIREVMQEPPAALPASPRSASQAGSADSLAAYGSHLFVVGRNGGSIRAIDVRDPMSPQVTSVLPISSDYSFGITHQEAAGTTYKPYRRGIAVRGTRLFATGLNDVRIVELE